METLQVESFPGGPWLITETKQNRQLEGGLIDNPGLDPPAQIEHQSIQHHINCLWSKKLLFQPLIGHQFGSSKPVKRTGPVFLAHTFTSGDGKGTEIR